MASPTLSDADTRTVKGEAEQWTVKDTHQENISFSNVRPVNVKVRDLTVEVDAPKSLAQRLSFKKKPSADPERGNADRKRILDTISADFPQGSLSAILGSSGSGKTTMLNILSRRMRSSNLNVTGVVEFNGSPKLSSISNAYVTQMDLLLPTLTVRETLLYAAALRLPATTDTAKRAQLVEEVILELGLKECASTYVGDGESHKGCSGGERRRVSIGVQMLSNPSVLFCDEPTTGLDATSAYQLVKTLKSLALKGRTIICTIHQPRHDIFFLFDRITLLSQGHALYSGLTDGALPWFEDLLPGSFHKRVNPADYLIQVAAVDSRTPEAETETQGRLNMLIQAWKKESPMRFDSSSNKEASHAASGFAVDEHAKSEAAPLMRQIAVLTSRTIRTTIRDPMGLAAAWMEAVLMSLVCGLVFLQLGKDQGGIRSREAALYISAGLQGYLVLLYETWRLAGVDIALFDRERGEGVIGVTAWMISRRLARGLLEDVAVPFLFSVIFYFMCGFDADGVQFFKFYAVIFLNQLIAVNFAVLCVGVSRDFSIATLVGNLSFTVQSFSCGFFIQANSIPVYVRWLKWIAYIYYAFAALAVNEFTDEYYDCPSGDAATDPDCLQYRGNFILQNLSFDPNWYVIPVIVMLAFVVIFMLIGGLLLKFWTVDIRVGGVQQPKEIAQKDKLTKTRSERDPTPPIDVDLLDFSLAIEKPLARGELKQKTILHSVTTRFEAGAVNVIMGPSGSGKSSLLNTMALRVHSSPLVRYRAGGRMLLNGVDPGDSIVRSLCSYVTQDDNSLLPYLTVREMLHFAAGLRLPKEMTKEQKRQKAEEVILKLGLRDCADTLIGSEFIKGISGGEKRRVSIAVQILTEPRILIADEPTSGLDAFTASSILDVLNSLAQEGRTVIITIHQSRSELFDQFGNLLLLAKGGHVAYSGRAADMISYFTGLGHAYPPMSNPSDWALDLVSVDLRSAKEEEESRAKVQRILDVYDPKAHFNFEKHRQVALPGELGRMRKRMAPLWVAVPILLKRGMLNFKRQPNLAGARIGQVVGLGGALALFFAPLGRDYYDASMNIVGAIQEILPMYFVGMLQNVAMYPTERDVFYKENDDRAYSLEAFFLSYTILEVPFEIVSALLFSLLGCIAINLNRTISMYFIVALNAFCIVSCGESIGIIFNTLFQSTGFALNVTSTVLSIGTFMSGLLSVDMIGFLKGINYISPLKYAAENLMPYTLRGMIFTCEDFQRLPDGHCPLETGEQVLQLFHMDIDPVPRLGAIVATTVVYRLVAYLVLRLVRTDVGGLWRRKRE
ncbi:P-loop containing nucleoside triphosphate hydrolase protein [Schizophyllum amplum]|uniref:P-loop containing nucleoside triphosphate hydrolase protein n=1 Tax=Schizophyllum amplum TaxID=97359 RepID=A0A550CQU0_9AGAR|nr:P-loop containing nucleoside triphosphate hydrolase protein [Auriculariopsis ampla]